MRIEKAIRIRFCACNHCSSDNKKPNLEYISGVFFKSEVAKAPYKRETELRDKQGKEKCACGLLIQNEAIVDLDHQCD